MTKYERRVRGTQGVLTGVVVVLLPCSIYAAEAPVSGAASAASTQTAALEEMVVTARRRTEPLQSVPAVVTAISGKDIEAKRITTAQDLQQYVPSMAAYAFSSIRDGTSYSLRGQTTTVGATSGVVVYINEVPMASDLASSSSGGGTGLYLDLDNLQVLNGPQGTLFGRNTTGGAVLLQPKLPTDRVEGYAQVGFGNYSNQEYEGVFNAPLVHDKLLLRVAGLRQKRDGFTENLAGGGNLDNRDTWAYRVSLTFRPTQALENTTVFYENSSNSRGTSRIMTDLDPLGATAGLYSGLFGTPSVQQAFLAQQARNDVRVVDNTIPQQESSRYWLISNTTKWDITDTLTLKNIAAYQSIQSNRFGDEDGTRIPILYNELFGHTTTFSEEVQLQGKSLSDNLDWTVGGFIDYSHPDGPQPTGVVVFDGLGPFFSLLGFPVSSFSDSGTQRRSRALYAQATYNLGGVIPALDGVHFTGGYRYTWDYRSDFSTNLGLKTTNAAVIKSNEGTWTLGLDYQIGPKTFLYAKGSHGYKAGGFNPATATPAFSVFTPEFVKDVEFGLKKDWTFNTVQIRTNVDAFRTYYTDIQKLALVVDGSGLPFTITQNVAAAQIDGIEVSSTIIPNKLLEFSGTYSYLKARYTKATGGFDPTLPFYYTPQNKYSVAGTFHVPISGDLGEMSVSASYSRTGHMFAANSNRQVGDTFPGYGVLNMRADWTNIGGSTIDLGVFVTNLTNADYLITQIPLYRDFGFNAGSYGEPRMYGFKLRYHWGPGEDSN